MVPGGGIEPPTRGFSIRCSTPELPGHSLQLARLEKRPCEQMKRRYGVGLADWQEGKGSNLSPFAYSRVSQSLCARLSGSTGSPGTEYPSPNHCAKSRSLQRCEQKGANSATRGFPQMGQGRCDFVIRREFEHWAPRAQEPDWPLSAPCGQCAWRVPLAIRA